MAFPLLPCKETGNGLLSSPEKKGALLLLFSFEGEGGWPSLFSLKGSGVGPPSH